MHAGVTIFADPSTGKRYVRKYVGPEDVAEGLFDKEASVLQELKGHPNINSISAAYREGNKGVLWVRYCDSATVQYVEDRFYERGIQSMPEPFVWHVLWGLAAALAWAAHGVDVTKSGVRDRRDTGVGVLHRDIKPDNVFLQSEPGRTYPRVVLGDFGLGTTVARALDEARKTRRFREFKLVGPFVLPGESPSGASDIWAVGQTVLCMIGNFFRDGRLERSFESCGISEALKTVIMAMMQPDPKCRPNAIKLFGWIEHHGKKTVQSGQCGSGRHLPIWSLPLDAGYQPARPAPAHAPSGRSGAIHELREPQRGRTHSAAPAPVAVPRAGSSGHGRSFDVRIAEPRRSHGQHNHSHGHGLSDSLRPPRPPQPPPPPAMPHWPGRSRSHSHHHKHHQPRGLGRYASHGPPAPQQPLVSSGRGGSGSHRRHAHEVQEPRVPPRAHGHGGMAPPPSSFRPPPIVHHPVQVGGHHSGSLGGQYNPTPPLPPLRRRSGSHGLFLRR